MFTNYFLLLVVLIIFAALLIYARLKKLLSQAKAAEIGDIKVLEVSLSKIEDESSANSKNLAFAMAAENMFSALHGLLKEDLKLQEHISFEIISSGSEGIRFYVALPENIAKFVEGQIYAQHPSAQIHVVEDYAQNLSVENISFDISTISLTKPSYVPIRGYEDFEVDPLSALTSAITDVAEDEKVWVQFVIKPLPDIWQQEGFTYVQTVREGIAMGPQNITEFGKAALIDGIKEIFGTAVKAPIAAVSRPPEEAKYKAPEKSQAMRLGAGQELELRSIEEKLRHMGFSVVVRVLTSAHTPERVTANMRHVLASFRQFSTASSNSFSSHLVSNKQEELHKYKERFFDDSKALILTTKELATVFHFPSAGITTPNISWTYSRRSEPPSNLPIDKCVYIGETMYRSNKVKFGLENGDDRLRHLYIIGKSGTGKSTLLETMMTQDIVNGEGVGILDPHGETIERILERIPDERVDDVIYFDPADTERPVGLNLLEMEDPSQKNLMASGLVSAIKQHFEYSWGPRLEYLLNYSILTLLEVPGTTMLGITRLLEDKNYRNYILSHVSDPVVKRFWNTEYKNLSGNQRFVTEAIAPIQNKVNRFLASTTIRNILGQKKSTIDLWDAMNSGKIILMNLSKGKIGSDNANLLGALLVSRIQFFALQRAKIPHDQRRPFYLYVDEFQNFATGSFEEILSESRKYKLGLYLTHQFTAQLPEELLKAVFGNVGTIASFSVGASDAYAMEQEFAPYFNAEDIISLERFQIYIKLMIDGMTSHPFSAKILLPWEGEFMVQRTGNKEKVMERSRQKHGTPSDYVTEKINKWVETSFDRGKAISESYRNKPDNRNKTNLGSTRKGGYNAGR